MTKLLTTGQIASMFGVHRTTVHRWVEAGDLPIALEVNGVRMFNVADVERLAAERAEAKA